MSSCFLDSFPRSRADTSGRRYHLSQRADDVPQWLYWTAAASSSTSLCIPAGGSRHGTGYCSCGTTTCHRTLLSICCAAFPSALGRGFFSFSFLTLLKRNICNRGRDVRTTLSVRETVSIERQMSMHGRPMYCGAARTFADRKPGRE